jgi:hypothetical protein
VIANDVITTEPLLLCPPGGITFEARLVPVAHHSSDPDLRIALCGEEIAGVPSFGDFEVCPDCERLLRGGTR